MPDIYLIYAYTRGHWLFRGPPPIAAINICANFYYLRGTFHD